MGLSQHHPVKIFSAQMKYFFWIAKEIIFSLRNSSLIFLFFHLVSTSAMAADWYVRAGVSGNGTSWTNAWSDVTNIVWSSINPGDTIWIAGGSYGYLTPSANGTGDADSLRVKIKRATAVQHGSDSGWSTSLSTQVVLTGITIASDYITIDGQVERGILIPSGSGNGISFTTSHIYVNLSYLDIAGSCTGNGPNCTYGADSRAIDMSGVAQKRFIKIQHNKLHGQCTIVWNYDADDILYEYNEFYGNYAATDPINCHTNVMAVSQTSNFTFRYNIVHDYGLEGIMYKWDNNVNHYIYGNIWYAGYAPGSTNGGGNRILEVSDNVTGPIYFYNNTIDDFALGIREDTNSGGSWAKGSMSMNNIYWRAPAASSGITEDYSLCSDSFCPGSHSIPNANNPFVNLLGHDYHVVSTVSPTTPKDKGINLGPAFSLDLYGTVRGYDGFWDIGALENNSSQSLVLQAPQNLKVIQ
ncbi:MAG: hypothetical protein ACXVCP_09010 [Bdellovibrio sp.]